jgi:hypothetical protein
MMLSETFISLTTDFSIAPVYDDLELAILRTVAYADVFDYPLKAAEIRRYLIGVQATEEEVELALESCSAKHGRLRYTQGFYTLAGRERLVDLRHKREVIGQRRWLIVQRYGKWIAALPFVRMVAVTGALAVDNEDGSDIDFLIVTQAGRVWLCRGLVLLLVYWARRYGDEICPNYFLSESALSLSEKNLYTAHEMAQMVPLYGMNVYQRMRRFNPWVSDFLPNASGLPLRMGEPVALNVGSSTVRHAMERLLLTPPGDWVENWEMRRKVRKFRSQDPQAAETSFCRDWCKGHFGGYGQKTKQAYEARLRALGVAEDRWELR